MCEFRAVSGELRTSSWARWAATVTVLTMTVMAAASMAQAALPNTTSPPAPRATALALFNAHIHTADPAKPTAEAVLAVDGRIALVGTSEQILSHAPPEARRIDLKGAAVLPGLTDSHAHLADIGLRELEFSLEGVASLPDLQGRLRQRARATPPGDWITGGGWIESRWTPAAFPARQDLDACQAIIPLP